MPARPYKPRDKAKVEVGVRIAERWMIAALRHRRFYSVAELNEAIIELRDRINHRGFRKREGSRASLFATLDQPALQPLPQQRMCWPNGRRSVPTSTTTWRWTAIITAFLTSWSGSNWKPDSLSRRLRSSPWRACGFAPAQRASYRHTTVAEHRPKSHQAHLEWTPSQVDSLGRVGRSCHRTSRQSHSGDKAASRDGIPLLPGHFAPGKNILGRTTGSRQPARAYNCRPSPIESALDSEALARPSNGPSIRKMESRAAAMKTCAGASYYDPPTTLLQ